MGGRLVTVTPRDQSRTRGELSLGCRGVKLIEERIAVPGPGCEINAAVLRPAGDGPWPGVLLYTDIFQLTESTLRTARRLAAEGFLVCVPEIYPHGPLAGVALEFDDAGKQAGLAGAAAMTTAEFDADRAAVLDHLAPARTCPPSR